jgi:uncharacterized peroxidase-related enzyme
VPKESEVDESVRPLLEENRKMAGYVENWIISLALNPGTLKRAVDYFASLFNPKEGKLSVVDKELLALIVSADNGCAYCEAHHTKGYAEAIGDTLRARRMALGYEHVPDLTEREEALANLAIRITRNPSAVCDADLEALRRLDFDDPAILEAIETIAFFNYTNRVAISINNIPENQLFDIEKR